MVTRRSTCLFVAGLAAAVLTGTAYTDHRPGNIVVVGGTLALSGRYAEPAGRYLNAWKLYVDELNQMRELGINVKMFAGTVGPGLAKFVEELGETAEFILGFTQWEPRATLGYSGIKEFNEGYEKRYGVKPNYHAAGGYEVMQILEAAVKHAGSLDPQKVRDALASITVETIKGPYKADGQGLSTMDGLTFQIQNGQRVIVWPKHMAEAKYILPMPRWEQRPKN